MEKCRKLVKYASIDALMQLHDERKITSDAVSSGANYLIVALQNISSQNNMTILYSTRDAHLFAWAKRVMSHLLGVCQGSENVQVVLAYAGTDGVLDLESPVNNMNCISCLKGN